MLLEIDNGQLYYETSEDLTKTSKPILFVLPGGPGGSHAIYKFHSLDLEDFFCIVYHDPRGCGKSQGFTHSSATMKNYINDIENLRKHLNISQFYILGTSYGSMCAIGYAIRYPKHLTKLILIGGAPSFRFLDQAKKNLATRGSDEQKKIAEYLWNGNFENNEHVSEFMQIMKPLYSKNETYIKTISKGPSFSYEVLNYGFSDFLKKFDFEPDLTKINCPILIMVGESDWINDPVLFNPFLKMKNVSFNILKNCGHFVAIDQHEEYIKLIKAFTK